MQFLAARSRWTNLCSARYSIPFAIWWHIPSISFLEVMTYLKGLHEMISLYTTILQTWVAVASFAFSSCCLWCFTYSKILPLAMNGMIRSGISLSMLTPIRDITCGWSKDSIVSISLVSFLTSVVENRAKVKEIVYYYLASLSEGKAHLDSSQIHVFKRTVSYIK